MAVRDRFDIDPDNLKQLPWFRTGNGQRVMTAYERLDAMIVGFLRKYSALFVRLAVAIVFIWFGALKVIGRSPVEDLVADTVAWLPAGVLVPGIGVLELLIGFGLLLAVGLRIVLLLFMLQMAGTFLIFLTQPGEAFQDGNPLLLTVLGEFVIKNLVLIAAGLAIGSRVQSSTDRRLNGYVLGRVPQPR